jgi:cytoskeletal protein RodZ
MQKKKYIKKKKSKKSRKRKKNRKRKREKTYGLLPRFILCLFYVFD